jgi:hypothetical protein
MSSQNRQSLTGAYHEPGSYTFSSRQLLMLAAESAERATSAKATNPSVLTADTITAIVLSAAAAEGFINEFGTRLTLLGRSGTSGSTALDHLAETGKKLEACERARTDVATKYLTAGELLQPRALVKGQPPFQDFVQLIRVRNEHLHPKVQTEPHGCFDFFVRKGWTYNKPSDYPKLGGWLMQLQTPEVARWACRAAQGVVDPLVKGLWNVDPWAQPLAIGLIPWRDAAFDPRIQE